MFKKINVALFVSLFISAFAFAGSAYALTNYR